MTEQGLALRMRVPWRPACLSQLLRHHRKPRVSQAF